MSNPFTPIETAKLSWFEGLPFSQTFNDIYFSTENGLAETEHVFIQGNQLITRWQNLDSRQQQSFTIAETGFGSGLNFLLSWQRWLEHAPENARLHFFSCEKFPLRREDLQRSLDLWPQLEKQAQTFIDSYPILTPGFHQFQFEGGRVNLTLMLGEATDCFNQLLVCGDPQLERTLRPVYIDAWFLDGFSPAKNQAMWSIELFEIIALLSKPGTSLATFSAASLVRNNLKETGFLVKKIKGFGRKNEMVVGQFKAQISSQKKLRSTPWHISAQTSFKTKKAIVLGAGLAGCYTSHALAKRGWQVILIDQNDSVGEGASGNRQAVLYPKFSAYRSPLTDFMLTAFLYASRVYRQLINEKPIGNLSGILQLAFNSKERQSQESLAGWLNEYPELALLVDASEASAKAGIELGHGGLFIPNTGWLDSNALCRLLVETSGIEWVPDTHIPELIRQNGCWHAAGHEAEILVIANGFQAKQFAETAYLPLKPIRGQMTMIASNSQSLPLKIPLCGDGHILPALDGLHAFGASYHLGDTKLSSLAGDDKDNLKRLAAMPAQTAWSEEIMGNWVGVRAATTDYLPLVGPVPDENNFVSRFASLATNARRWLAVPGDYLPGLYLCAGFGSRGLTTIPLCAEWLASTVNNELSQLPRSMIQSLAPARFLLKDIIRSRS